MLTLQEAHDKLGEAYAELESKRTEMKNLSSQNHNLRIKEVALVETHSTSVLSMETELREAHHAVEMSVLESRHRDEEIASLKLKLGKKSAIEDELASIIRRSEDAARSEKAQEEETQEIQAELRAIAGQVTAVRGERDAAKEGEAHYKSQVSLLTKELHEAQSHAALSEARLKETRHSITGSENLRNGEHSSSVRRGSLGVEMQSVEMFIGR